MYRTISGVGDHYILKEFVKKDDEKKSGVLIIPGKKKTKVYQVYHSPERENCDNHELVYIKGYADIIEIEDETFYVVHKDNIIALLNDSVSSNRK